MRQDMRDEDSGVETNYSPSGVFRGPGTQMSENIGTFNVGGKIDQPEAKQNLLGSEMQTEPLAKLGSTGQEKRIIKSFTKVDSPDAPRNLLGGDEEEQKRAQEQAEFMNASMSRQEEYARRGRRLNRLENQHSIKDIAQFRGAVREREDWSKTEAVEKDWNYNQAYQVAKDSAEAFGMNAKQLADEEIIEGTITKDGYLSEGGKILQPGYTIRVEEVEETREILERRFKLDVNGKLLDEWYDGRDRTVVVEKPYFGTEEERKAFARANEELLHLMINSEKLHQMTAIFDRNKDDLDNLVGVFFKNQIGPNNEQLEWFWTAADISMISADDFKKDEEGKEKGVNHELGDKRDKSTRLLHLIGYCETKEKMEELLNTTFHLEEILDKKTINRVLNLMKKDTVVKKDKAVFSMNEITGADTDDKKFEIVARFLIGKNLKITEDGGIKQYTLGSWNDRDPSKSGWMTKDQRDPSKSGQESRGAGAIRMEKDAGVRGYLTSFGNPYARDKIDPLYAVLGRIGTIMGDEVQDKFAVRDADRFFWVYGMRDQLGSEVYGPLPTGEELVDMWNEVAETNSKGQDGEKVWYEKVREKYGKNFSCPGGPIGSDLGKLINTELWRMKDIVKERPGGPILTVDKFNRFTQGFFNQIRTEVEVQYRDGTSKTVTRSVNEQWGGYKGKVRDERGNYVDDTLLGVEKPRDLGEVKWRQVSVPDEDRWYGALESIDVSKYETIEKGASDVFVADAGGVGDNASYYFWSMNFFTGDPNPEKRGWAEINMEEDALRPDDFTKPKMFTNRIKFYDIPLHPPIMAWGNHREVEREAKQRGKTVEKVLNERQAQMVDGYKKNLYDGWRSLPMLWPTIMALDENKIAYAMGDAMGRTEHLPRNMVADKMAAQYGFLDPKLIGSAPKHRQKLLK